MHLSPVKARILLGTLVAVLTFSALFAYDKAMDLPSERPPAPRARLTAVFESLAKRRELFGRRECLQLQPHHCGRASWMEGRRGLPLQVGVADSRLRPVRVRVEYPGLWGTNTVSMVVCERAGPNATARYVVHMGRRLVARPVVNDSTFTQSASFVLHTGRYFPGFFALEPGDMPGHFVVARNTSLIVIPRTKGRAFRANASWMVVEDEASLSRKATPIHLLEHSVSAGFKIPNTFDDRQTCSVQHRGCCRVGNTAYAMPEAGAAGPASGQPSSRDVAAVIISSAKTFRSRRHLLNRWILKPIQTHATDIPWKRAIISLDCFARDIDPSLEKTDWVVGPLGSGPSGMSAVAVRVPMVLHWTFERYPESAWYFMVDDDTLVFSANIAWALTHLPQPYEKLWYVGHGSEWKVKERFHGNMAYGGAGVLFSNKAGKVWRRHWRGDYQRAAGAWMRNGSCSHGGGDGSICRCLHEAAERADLLTDFRGLHQFDIVGTSEMLSLVADTCPNCPSVYEQTGLWFDDIVSRHNVLTFHHALAIETGSLFPGRNSTATSQMLLDAFDAHPPTLFMKRVCGRAQPGYTLCINFGHRLQIFSGSLDPADAKRLIETRDGTAAADPVAHLVSLVAREHVRAGQLCTLHYERSPRLGEYVYASSALLPRPSHDAPCSGSAFVSIASGSMTLNITYGAAQITWVVNVSHLLP